MFSGTNGKQKQVVTLLGNVDPIPMGVVEVKPRKLAVGDLPIGRVTEKNLVIKNTGDAEFSINRVVSKKFKTVFFDAAEGDGGLRVKPGQSVVVKLGLKPVKAGRYLDYVVIFGEARNLTENGYKVVVLGKAK